MLNKKAIKYVEAKIVEDAGKEVENIIEDLKDSGLSISDQLLELENAQRLFETMGVILKLMMGDNLLGAGETLH